VPWRVRQLHAHNHLTSAQATRFTNSATSKPLATTSSQLAQHAWDSRSRTRPQVTGRHVLSGGSVEREQLLLRRRLCTLHTAHRCSVRPSASRTHVVSQSVSQSVGRSVGRSVSRSVSHAVQRTSCVADPPNRLRLSSTARRLLHRLGTAAQRRHTNNKPSRTFDLRRRWLWWWWWR